MFLTLTVVGAIWMVAIPAIVIGVLSFWSRPRHAARPKPVAPGGSRPEAGLRLIEGGAGVLRPRVGRADYGSVMSGPVYRP